MNTNAGEIALVALASLDELTLQKDWAKMPKTRKRIRYVINVANNQIKSLAADVNSSPRQPLPPAASR